MLAPQAVGALILPEQPLTDGGCNMPDGSVQFHEIGFGPHGVEPQDFRFFRAHEIEQTHGHLYLESELAGHEIGIDRQFQSAVSLLRVG